MQSLLALIIAGLVYCLTRFLYWYFTVARRVIQMTANIPGTCRFLPLEAGALNLILRQKKLQEIRKLNRKHGDIFKVWTTPFDPTIVLCHPRLARDILRTEEPKPYSKTEYAALKDFLGEMLFVSHGIPWKRNRRLLTPAYHLTMLRTYIHVMNKTTTDLIRVLDSFSASGKSFDISQVTAMFALDAVFNSHFGFEGTIQKPDGRHKVIDIMKAFENGVHCRSTRPYLFDWAFSLTSAGRKFYKAKNEVTLFARELIERQREKLKSAQAFGSREFLNILLMARDEDGMGMNDSEIESEVIGFMFAGIDTTSTTLSWILYTLAKHPHHQEMCRNEIQGILGDRATDEVINDDLGKLEYLTRVIKEVMRLYSIVPGISRELSRDLQICDHVIPKGCVVGISLYLIHHHPEVWENPDVFDPDRFLEENFSRHGPYDFIPFSAGPRNCIGQHFAMNLLKISAARILNRFEVQLDREKPVTPDVVITVKSENGIWLTLKQIPPSTNLSD